MKVNKKVTIVMLSSLLAGLSVTNVAAQSYLNTDPNPWSYNIYNPS